MPGDNIVFFPKWTSLAGTGGGQVYYSDPYEVTPYKTLDVETLRAVVTAGGTVAARLEHSSDLQTWTEAGGSGNLTAGAVDAISKSSPARYVRMKITVTAAGAVATLWSRGVARDA